MASHALGSLVNIVSSKDSRIPSPRPTHQKYTPETARPAPLELNAIIDTASARNQDQISPVSNGDRTPNELEMSRPPTPKHLNAVSTVQTWANPYMNRYRLLAACLIYFSNGMNDAVTGALIPSIEVHYSIGYAIVSLVFVTNAVGFISAAFIVDLLVSRVGRAKALVVAEVILLVGYIMLVCTPPYPVVVFSFFFLGFGMAINIAINNIFCANLAQATIISGLAHGSYGAGGTVAPIIATAMVSAGLLWSRYHFILVGLRVACAVVAGWANWSAERDTEEHDEPVPILAELGRSAEGNETISTTAAAQTASPPSKAKLIQTALRNPTTSLGALFIFAYQGAEVSVSGWVISFLISYRNGDPGKVGNVTAGFWGGITLGRFVLVHLAPLLGETPLVYTLLLGSLILQLLTWHIPSLVSNYISISLLGLLLGPIYPCAQTIFARSLPRELQMTAVGVISSAGSSGGAVAPFTTGLMAQRWGTWVLHPVCVGLLVGMGGCWWGLRERGKKKE